MANRARRKYGMPFRGYMGSLLAHVCPPDAAATGSFNAVYRPADGSFVRRSGMTIKNDTLGGDGGVGGSSYYYGATGLLEGKWTAKDRMMAELVSPSLSSVPTYSVLYTKDTISSGYVDDGRFGQLYFPSGTTNQVCGKSLGTGATPSSTHYTGNGTDNFVCVPLWYDSGDGGMTRLANPLTRRFHCPGSRRFLDVGDWRHFPSYYGTPSKWNRRFNSATDSGSEKEVHYPSGPVPPLWCPIPTWSTPGATVAAWKSGYRFFVSVMFKNEDGSWSMPAVPRAINSTLTSGFGLTTVSGTAGQFCASVTWTIPIGPPGTVARAILRSDQVDSLAANLVDPSPDKLKIAAVINDNTSTTYVDYSGDDAALFDDPDKLYFRWDHIMPPPSRHIWEFDGRTAHGYSRTSRCAIFLAPTAITTAKDLNLAYDSASFGTHKFYVLNDGTNLILKYDNTSTTATQSIALSGKTLQDLVDTINATTTSSAAKEWRAQVAPGASREALATNLLRHNITVSSSATASATFITSSSGFSGVAVGMRIKAVTDKIGSGTYVKSVETASKINLCDSTGAAKAVAGAFTSEPLVFYHDLGDATPTGATSVGDQRIVGGSYYGCLYFKNSYFASEPSGKSAIWMTVGGPMQVRQSANAFVSASSNKHIPPGNPGICMGGGGLADGCVVLFANERHVLRNTRGGRTGLDEDYRLDRTSRAGCVCDGGVVVGFGWVGYPSYEGFIAADVNNEVNLTRPVWDAGAGRGELGYELKLCVGASAKDTDDAMFMAAVVGNRLHLCFRHAPSSPTGVQTMRLVMDFGEGSQASGLGQLLDANQAPWGWSAPLIRRYGSGNYAPNVSSICGVRAGGSTGVSLYGAVRGNLGTTADGMVMQIDSGSRDNAAVLISDAVNCSTDFFDSLRHKAANDSIVKFSATDDATGITAKMTGSPSESATQTVALSPDSRDYTLAFVQWGNAVRGKNESLAFTFEDDGSSVKASEFWGVESSADLLNTYK